MKWPSLSKCCTIVVLYNQRRLFAGFVLDISRALSVLLSKVFCKDLLYFMEYNLLWEETSPKEIEEQRLSSFSLSSGNQSFDISVFVCVSVQLFKLHFTGWLPIYVGNKPKNGWFTQNCSQLQHLKSLEFLTETLDVPLLQLI